MECFAYPPINLAGKEITQAENENIDEEETLRRRKRKRQKQKEKKDTNISKTKINGETKIGRQLVSCFNFRKCKLDPNEERNRERERRENGEKECAWHG